MWCLTCNSTNLSKKKIVIIALIVGAIGGAIGGALYYSSTINSTITIAVLPIILPLGYIIMCGVMAGLMFLSGRLSKKSETHHSRSANQPEQAKELATLESIAEDKKSSSS